MRYLTLLTIGSLSMSGCSHTGVEDLMCESSGMAGVAFGQQIEQRPAAVVEVADSGVTYYGLEPLVDIRPFENLIVGVSPTSRQVFSIRLEKYGDETELDKTIKAYKEALSQAHSSVTWTVIGNHHYGEQLEGLDLALYRIGDFGDGQPTNLLSYDCDSKPYRRIVLDEAREAIRGN